MNTLAITFPPKPFIILIITLGAIGFCTAYSLEKQEEMKAKECQEACVKW